MPELAGSVGDAFQARVREQEDAWLSPLAVRSYETRGRERDEEPCAMRTPFQRDRDRIVHSKPFRRLKGKTQVFIDPQGDHYRTRMTHTLETTAISRVVARALQLNEDLTEAIGLGHDLGHTPFGHAGEDALRYGLLVESDLPRAEIELLGPSGSRRIDRLVHDLVETSADANDIRQSEEIGAAMHRLRDFMFERVYLADASHEEHRRAHETIARIVAHLVGRGDTPDEIVEYVAGM